MRGETHAIIRIVEDLPAPLGPRKPNDSPRATSMSIPSTAVKSPNVLISPLALTIASEGTGSRYRRAQTGSSCFSHAQLGVAKRGHGPV